MYNLKKKILSSPQNCTTSHGEHRLYHGCTSIDVDGCNKVSNDPSSWTLWPFIHFDLFSDHQGSCYKLTGHSRDFEVAREAITSCPLETTGQEGWTVTREHKIFSWMISCSRIWSSESGPPWFIGHTIWYPEGWGHRSFFEKKNKNKNKNTHTHPPPHTHTKNTCWGWKRKTNKLH